MFDAITHAIFCAQTWGGKMQKKIISGIFVQYAINNFISSFLIAEINCMATEM